MNTFARPLRLHLERRRTRICLGCMSVVGWVWAQISPVPPSLRITLGTTNVEEGLSVPSGGDGVNLPAVVNGICARKISGDRSMYMYARVGNAAWSNRVGDAWLVAEVWDDHITRITVEYERGIADGSWRDSYAEASNACWLTGSGEWRRVQFHLPDFSSFGRQNHQASFRLCSRELVVRSMELHATPLPDNGEAVAIPAKVRVNRDPGMELTFGNDADGADAALFEAMSVTSVESYVDWAGVEKSLGVWDWSQWDRQVAVLEKAGIKWVPFLIAGPAYATPLWFHHSSASRYFRCLEHGEDSKVQSLFNPALKPQVIRFLDAFAERYRDRGVIESVLLGITGIYGESIYPAGPEDGWTARLTGPYHNHTGWWAGDPLAVSAFRAAMCDRYKTVERLNHAWHTHYMSLDEVAPWLPAHAPSDRARVDFIEWYQQVMTDWSAFWVKATRVRFPDTPIYLCTGGDGSPVLGADFTAQAAAIAPWKAGIRITNEGSDYAHNFMLTREVTTATRFYRTFCGFEPAARVNAQGVVARIYNATASGARQLHFYTANVLGDDTNALPHFTRWIPLLIPRHPEPELAVYASRESWALEPEANGRFALIGRTLRDIADFDLVTRRSVADGALNTHALLILAESPVLEPDTAKTIEEWVRAGGTLLVLAKSTAPFASRLYDLTAWRERMLPPLTDVSHSFNWVVDGPFPSSWALNIGAQDDRMWLEGGWHAPESRGEATCRWTGDGAAIVFLPGTPGEKRAIRLMAHIPQTALSQGPVRLLLDGHAVGTIPQSGWVDTVFEMPGVVAKTGVTRLEIQCSTWRPSEVLPTNQDDRRLGVEVRRVEWSRPGAAQRFARQVALRGHVDMSKLKSGIRNVGKGRVLHLDGLAEHPFRMAALLLALRPQLPDGKIDGGYTTRFANELLRYDTHTVTIDVLPAGP